MSAPSRRPPREPSAPQTTTQRRAEIIIRAWLVLGSLAILVMAVYKVPIILFKIGWITKPPSWYRPIRIEEEVIYRTRDNREFTRAEIESLKARRQYLEQSARLSSIWIDLQPYLLSQPVGDQWRPAETARRAVETLLYGLRGFGDFLIFFAIALLPWLLATGLAIFLIVRFIRWRARIRGARTSGPTSEEKAM